MAMTVQQIHPVAHLPLVLGVLRRLEVATVIDRLIPPHPAHKLSSRFAYFYWSFMQYCGHFLSERREQMRP